MTRKAGILFAPENAADVDVLATEILDDALYNILHDLVLKIHREEKMARAATAAIRVEKQAADATDGSLEVHPEVRVETQAAIYSEGKVILKGNPLKTVKEVVCPKCHLPRLQYPTEGKGARKPDPSVIYCKRMPFIDKPNHDIYGQTWVPLGPGRGKKKKDVDKRADMPADQKPTNLLSYPSATCSKCKRCILVTRLNNHMGSCIGNSGRVAGRAAAQKISSANASGANSQHEPTPPLSRRGTPIPSSATSATEPTRKRDHSDMNGEVDIKSETESSEPAPKRKKIKASSIAPSKIRIKPKSTTPVPIPITGLSTASLAKKEKEREREREKERERDKDRDRDRDREERRSKVVSESPIRPPLSISPSKGPGGLLKKKLKQSSPLKKVTKMKTIGTTGLGKKSREVKPDIKSSPAR